MKVSKILILMAIVTTLALVGCGNNDGDTKKPSIPAPLAAYGSCNLDLPSQDGSPVNLCLELTNAGSVSISEFQNSCTSDFHGNPSPTLCDRSPGRTLCHVVHPVTHEAYSFIFPIHHPAFPDLCSTHLSGHYQVL